MLGGRNVSTGFPSVVTAYAAKPTGPPVPGASFRAANLGYFYWDATRLAHGHWAGCHGIEVIASVA